MKYQPEGRHRATALLPTSLWYFPDRAVDFWRREYKHYSLDVPGPGALPMKTTPGPGHQSDTTERPA